MQNKNKKIAHIEFPDHLKPFIIALRDKMFQAVKNGKLDIETGEINWGKLEEDFSLPYGLLILITETNDVLDNLNMILEDMESLKNSITMFTGSPRRRLYLLVRTFFYEFYRLKDIFNLFLKGLVRRELINKKNANQFKEAFYYSFNFMFKTRSELIHNIKDFIGKEHVELDFYGILFEMGYLSDSYKINNQSIIQTKLNEVINIHLGALQEEGFRMRNAMQSILNLLTKLVKV